MKTSTLLFITMISLIFIIIPDNLFAYLDPGTGSFVIQMLMAGALTVIFVIKSYWKKIKNIFKKNNSDE